MTLLVDTAARQDLRISKQFQKKLLLDSAMTGLFCPGFSRRKVNYSSKRWLLKSSFKYWEYGEDGRPDRFIMAIADPDLMAKGHPGLVNPDA
jgi:hypothetical protein